MNPKSHIRVCAMMLVAIFSHSDYQGVYAAEDAVERAVSIVRGAFNPISTWLW